jgi:hypothetical protein
VIQCTNQSYNNIPVHESSLYNNLPRRDIVKNRTMHEEKQRLNMLAQMKNLSFSPMYLTGLQYALGSNMKITSRSETSYVQINYC